MLSVVLAMAASESARARSRSFFLSSERSNCAPQYVFLLSSSVCSFFRVATMASIISKTLLKPIFLPRSARAIRSSRGRSPGIVRLTAWSCARALMRTEVALLVSSCMKLLAEPGSVFLKRSRASSSLRTLMVSAKAASSSDRVCVRSSHSAVFVLQPFSRSARNFLSSSKASCVSPSSFFFSAISMANSPTFRVFVSMDAVRALISCVFASMRPS
mmetsp:Transcript_115964/g.237112  ORF Transcript_115964/g.237112 Transcript_115964/m.237112 type:complete len:216 (+) Transcript_115964:929-1576(+)